MPSAWRQRTTAAQNRGRTIERQADALRRALVALASGDAGAQQQAQLKVKAIRDQLVIAERLVAVLADGGVP